jgi:anaerobic dimethyl sulfoxide reductase subunit B (iron-sulfur subunit)
MARRYGIDFDPDRCVQCHACELACKALHRVEFGVRRRRVIPVWDGSFPTVTSRGVSLACLHCGNPPCEEACPRGAIRKRPEDGIVTVDRDKCFGCHLCLIACPFGVPQFDADGRMEKCDLCLDLVGQGKEPACVATCPAEALHFGTLEELSERASRGWARKIGEMTDRPTDR